jgi:hypothetical protein
MARTPTGSRSIPAPARSGELSIARRRQNPKEKSQLRASLVKPSHDPRNLEETKLVLSGTLVALRASLKLIGGDVSAAKSDQDAPARPDLARFDCYACHHELQADYGASWRQRRRRDGSPGRLMPSEWPVVLVPLAIDAAERQSPDFGEKPLQMHLSTLTDAVRMHPFAKPEAIARAAGDFANWIDSRLERLDRATIDDSSARRLLERLGKIAVDEVPDYDSARQIAWAFRTIYHESTPENKRDPRVETELAGLETALQLNLPPPRTAKSIVEASLPDRLRSAAQFEPAPFQAHFRRITNYLRRR